MASAGVNLALNGFRCHGCDVSGDAIKVIRQVEHLGFEEACEFARTVVGAEFQKISRSVPKSGKRRKLGRERWKTVLE
jgi:DNA primase